MNNGSSHHTHVESTQPDCCITEVMFPTCVQCLRDLRIERDCGEVMKQEQCALIIIFLRWAAGSLICCLIREIFGVDSVVKTPGDLPLSRNPLSVEPLTLFRMSQSVVQVIWNLGGRAKVCECAVGSSENVKSLWCFRSWLDCLVESWVWCQLFLCPRRSHFTLLLGSMFESSTLY